MRKCEVKIRPLAEADIEEIWLSIAKYNIPAAEKFAARLRHRIQVLSEFPEHGPPRPDIFGQVRIVVEENYLVIYLFKKGVVEIIRVVHGARNLSDLDFA